MGKSNTSTAAMQNEAIHWALLQRDDVMTSQNWIEFTEWLEADLQHREIYNSVVEADADLDVLADHIERPLAEQAANDNSFFGSAYRVWSSAGGIAAMLLIAAFVWPMFGSSAFVTYETQAGEIREVAVSPAVTVAMNGNTQLEIYEEDATIRMLKGEATYSVESDVPGALRVQIDDLVMVDYGTIFNVVRDGDMLRVAVTEGAVMIDPDSRKILVPAGNMVELRLDGEVVARTEHSADVVLAWQDRQIAFEERKVSEVVRDIERSYGIEISVTDSLGNQSITGVISLAGDEDRIVEDVAAVLGGRATRIDTGWTISN